MPVNESPIEGISAATLFTADMARAVRFYREPGFVLRYGGESSSAKLVARVESTVAGTDARLTEPGGTTGTDPAVAQAPVRSRGRKIGLVGSYHNRNFGDDLLATLFHRKLVDLGARDVIVFDCSPELAETLGIEACVSWKEHVHECAHIVVGGGGVLGEIDTGVAVFDSLVEIADTLSASGIGYSFVAVGAGPLRSEQSLSTVEHLVRKANVIVVRDTESAEMLSSFPGLQGRISLGADLAFSACADEIPGGSAAWAADILQDLPKPTLGISLIDVNCHDRPLTDPNALGTLRSQVLSLCQAHGIRSIVLLSNSANTTEGEASVAFMSGLGAKAPATRMLEHRNTWQTLALISELDLLISMKLHFAIAAYALRVPTACVGYHPKCRHFFRQIGKLEYYEDVTTFTDQSHVLSNFFTDWRQFYDTDDARPGIDERLAATHTVLSRIVQELAKG